MSDELGPCPFCGGEAVATINRDDDHDSFGEVCCKICPASVRGDYLAWFSGDGDAEESMGQAIAAWNRRSQVND